MSRVLLFQPAHPITPFILQTPSGRFSERGEECQEERALRRQANYTRTKRSEDIIFSVFYATHRPLIALHLAASRWTLDVTFHMRSNLTRLEVALPIVHES